MIRVAPPMKIFIIIACVLCACSEGFVIDNPDAEGDAASHDSSTRDASGADVSAVDAATDVPIADAGGADISPGVDAGPRDACDAPNPCSGACELPWLLATAQDGGGVGRCGGWVLRYSLSEAGACACTGYELGEQELPRTVSYIPGGTVLVGTQSRAFTFGASRTERSLGLDAAFDSFVVEGRVVGSDPVGVIMAGRSGGGAAKRLFVFEADGGFEALDFNPDMVLSGDTATQNPANRRGYRSADSFGRPSINSVFWEGGVEDLTHFDGGADGRLEAFYANGFHRTTIGLDDGVRHVANAEFAINNAPATISCSAAEFDECLYSAAAPDPMSEDHVYVACRQPVEDRSASRILRLHVADGSCTDLLPLEHWRSIRITDISIGLEDYWAP